MRAISLSRWIVGCVVGGLVGACSLFTSLSDLDSGIGAPSDAAAIEEVMVESSPPNAQVEASAGDSSSCPAGRGPDMVRIELVGGYFCVDSTEVSREQYAAFLSANPRTTHPRCAYKSSFIPQAGWPSDATTKRYPVVNVDWCDAEAFCAWAGKTLCGGVPSGSVPLALADDLERSALPAVCSHFGRQEFAYGDAAKPAQCNDFALGVGHAVDVGSMPLCQGAYDGVFDLAGNVEEWIDSCGAPSPDGGGNDVCETNGSGFREEEPPDLACTVHRPHPRSYVYDELGFRCCYAP